MEAVPQGPRLGMGVLHAYAVEANLGQAARENYHRQSCLSGDRRCVHVRKPRAEPLLWRAEPGEELIWGCTEHVGSRREETNNEVKSRHGDMRSSTW